MLGQHSLRLQPPRGERCVPVEAATTPVVAREAPPARRYTPAASSPRTTPGARAPGPRRARAAAAMARVVATRARGAEVPLALAFVDDDDALVPGGPAPAAAEPVDLSFFEEDDATLLAELLDERSPTAAARSAAASTCLNQAHRRGCTECVAALRRSGWWPRKRRPNAPPKRLAPAWHTPLWPADPQKSSPLPQVHPRAQPRGGAPVQAVRRRGAVRSAARRGRRGHSTVPSSQHIRAVC